MSGSRLRLARYVPATRAEGPELRFAIWTQGCALRCPGCCNPELFDAEGGRSMPVAALVSAALEARAQLGIEGVTLVGGEPLDQIEALVELCRELHARDLGVLLYSGHTLDEARSLPGFSALWPFVDTFVAGRFDASRRHTETRSFIGSSNQVLVHRSDRYRNHPQWQRPGATEVRIDAHGRLAVIGMPNAVRRIARALQHVEKP